MFTFTKKDFAVGDVVKVKNTSNSRYLFYQDYNDEGLYKVVGVYTDHVDLAGNNVTVFFKDIKNIKVPHIEPWINIGESVCLKDRESLYKSPIVVGSMLRLENKVTSVKELKRIDYNDDKECYEQVFTLDFPGDDSSWHWKNDCLVNTKIKVIGKPKYCNYADLVKFTSESVRVIRCKNCRYWHPEIVSSISKSMCLCELNSPKFPKTDYGYFTKADGFCPNGAPDPDRDYGYGKLSQINPKYTED